LRVTLTEAIQKYASWKTHAKSNMAAKHIDKKPTRDYIGGFEYETLKLI